MTKIAIIEDSKESNDEYKKIVLDLWSDCEVHQLYTVAEAIDAIKVNDYDIVISDIDLGAGSDKNGALKIAQAIDVQAIPLLIVSGIAEVEYQRSIYRSLAVWDYLQKPFSSDDLKTQLRRAMIIRKSFTGEIAAPKIYECPESSLKVNFNNRTMTWNGKKINMSMTRFSIIELLLKSPNDYVSYQDLMDILPSGKNKESLRVHMGEIKKEFESVDENFSRIKTKVMVGYGWILEKS